MNFVPTRQECLLLLFFAGGLLGGGCSRGTQTVTAEPDGPMVVRAFQVQAEPVRRSVEVVGTLHGDQEVMLSNEVAGRVAVIHADLGDRVSKGQILVALDPTEFQLAVERQQAALMEVLAQLGLKEEGQPPSDLTETSIVRRAAAEAAEAQANFGRAKTLRAEGVLSQQTYDSAEARFQTSQANYAAALEQARNLVARAQNLQAQLAIARENLADTRIQAPFAGTVRERLVEVGQYIREQTPVLALASMNPLKLRASVPERYFPYIQPEAPVEVAVEAYPGETFAGRITRVARAGQTETRTFTFEARIDNLGNRLRPGLFARTVLQTSKVDSVIRVPAEAVVSYYGVQKVYGIEGNVVREKVVKLGDRFGDLIEITEGLSPGDWIAVSELARLREGVPVRIEDSTGGER